MSGLHRLAGTLVPVGDDAQARMEDEAAALEGHRSQEAGQQAENLAHPPPAGDNRPALPVPSPSEARRMHWHMAAAEVYSCVCVAGAESGDAVKDEDDDETCGFCIFMKAGGCKDEFNVRKAPLFVMES